MQLIDIKRRYRSPSLEIKGVMPAGETVEQFLASGGVIQQVPVGAGVDYPIIINTTKSGAQINVGLSYVQKRGSKAHVNDDGFVQIKSKTNTGRSYISFVGGKYRANVPTKGSNKSGHFLTLQEAVEFRNETLLRNNFKVFD